MRSDGRRNDQLRPLSITTGYQKYADGSALIRWGETWVLCAASIENTVPPFRQERGGWVTAEYNMLPGSTRPRKGRHAGGREKEIQRLIGRSLRAAIDLDGLGAHTITVDCDVLQADGGTRVASITGGYVALALAARRLVRDGALEAMPTTHPVAAVSVGVIDDQARLDLPYAEDSAAQVDMNVVMMGSGKLIEVQGTAEHGTFDRAQLDTLLDLASAGIEQLGELQRRTLAACEAEAEVTVTLP